MWVRAPPGAPPAYEASLEQAVAGAGGHVGELHLYGSVATGTARSPGSDVDLLAIDADPEEMARLAGDLGRRFEALCREVTVGVAQPDDLPGADDAAYGNRVFLRHYCVPLLGGDAHRSARAFPGDRDAARGFNGDLAQHLTRWRAAEPDPALARRVGRKTLLAVAGLVSVTDATWTTDRDIAAHRWGELRPAWRGPAAVAPVVPGRDRRPDRGARRARGPGRGGGRRDRLRRADRAVAGPGT